MSNFFHSFLWNITKLYARDVCLTKSQHRRYIQNLVRVRPCNLARAVSLFTVLPMPSHDDLLWLVANRTQGSMRQCQNRLCVYTNLTYSCSFAHPSEKKTSTSVTVGTFFRILTNSRCISKPNSVSCSRSSEIQQNNFSASLLLSL